MPTVTQSLANRRSSSGGIADERAETARLLGRDGAEILWGESPTGRNPFWLGTPDRGAWLGRETHRAHLSGCASSLQWTQTLGRPASAGGRSASSTRRCACATRPDVPHELNLHAADGPSGIAGAQRAGL